MEATDLIRCQGRTLSGAEVMGVQKLIDEHPDWSRHEVALELCQQWDWRTAQGRLKSFAARELLLKLEQRVGLRLPAVRECQRRRSWSPKSKEPPQAEVVELLEQRLQELRPLSWQVAGYGSEFRSKALGYLRQYHYLGCNRPVGSHLLYLVQDRRGRDVAVHLVGAAAWQCADRDRFVGWSPSARRKHLPAVANHSRFLIFPWVKVPHLASHLLAELAWRLREDWPRYHGARLELLESFVEMGRFEGIAYRAANWQCVGQTTGRTRQEKHHRALAPRKAIWLYPLQKSFRTHLGVQDAGGVL